MIYKSGLLTKGFLFCVFFSVCISCNTEVKKEENKEMSANEVDSTQIKKIEKVFYSIPSPLQISSILKQAGAKYNKEFMNAPANTSKYNTNYSKALNIGIYGADLAYAGIFDQLQESILYLDAIRKLGSEIGLSSLFESEDFYSRFKKNMGTNNRDSLLALIADVFRESDDYLKEDEKYNLATLVIAGGWIEGLYLAAKQVEKDTTNSEMLTRMGEQKLSLTNLLFLMEDYKNEADIAALADQLNEVKTLYDNVSITRTEKEPQVDENSHTTTINTESKVSITSDQRKGITEKITIIRNEIIN